MDPHTLPTPGHETEGPLPAEKQQLIPNPNFVPTEAPQPNELHNLELPTVVPVNPTPPPDNQAPAAPVIPSQPAVIPLPGGATTTAADPAGTTGDLEADDRDVIEKAWVIKAKAIVDQTRDNPYQQNKEINKIKADYIKKRYNKEVKLSEE